MKETECKNVQYNMQEDIRRGLLLYINKSWWFLQYIYIIKIARVTKCMIDYGKRFIVECSLVHVKIKPNWTQYTTAHLQEKSCSPGILQIHVSC